MRSELAVESEISHDMITDPLVQNGARVYLRMESQKTGVFSQFLFQFNKNNYRSRVAHSENMQLQVFVYYVLNCFYIVYKDGIKPMWEDDRNKLGGRWLMTLNKQQRHNDLDRYWMETVTEQFLLCLYRMNQRSDALSGGWDLCGSERP